MLDSFRQFLSREYDRRSSVNQRYSKRAFARDIGVSKTLLHEVLSGKKGMTLKTMTKVADNLNLSESHKQQILNTHAHELRNELTSNDFSQMHDWYYFAILSLATLPEAPADSRWISERLGIPEATSQNALEKLLHLNLLEVKDNFLKRTKIRLNASWGRSSANLKMFHSQNLERAEKALFESPFESRTVSSITTAVSRSQFEKARKEIDSFQAKMMKLMDDCYDAEEVYTLAIQFFPQTEGFRENF